MGAARSRTLRWLVVATALATMAAACGDDDDDSASTATTAAASAPASTTAGGATASTTGGAATPSTVATPTTQAAAAADPNGELRIAWDLTAIGGIDLDPGSSDNVTDWQFHDLIYGSPLQLTPAGGFEPELASSYKIVDSKTITVSLRPGLKYSDGSPLTANDVPPTIARYTEALATKKDNLNPRINDIDSIEVTSPTDFTIHLKTDTAGDAVSMLANREFAIQPAAQTADQAESKPVGAGPYMVESFTKGQELVLAKNPNYYDPSVQQLAKIHFVQVDSASTANALKGGQVDLTPNYNSTDYAGIKDDKDFTTQVLASDSNFIYYGVCKDAGSPYEDVRVRQAIEYAIDRDEINDAAFDGLGEPMTQYWPKSSQYYDPAVADLAKHDPDKAKQLLQEAGVANEDLRVIVLSSLPFHNDAALTMGEELKAVGLDLTIVPTQDIIGDFFSGKKEAAVLTGWVRGGIQKVTRMFVSSEANICNYTNPTITDLTTKIPALDPNSPEVIQDWKQLSRFVMENALFVPLVWQPTIVAFKTDRVGGLTQVYPSSEGVNLRGVYVPK